MYEKEQFWMCVLLASLCFSSRVLFSLETFWLDAFVLFLYSAPFSLSQKVLTQNVAEYQTKIGEKSV